MIDDDRGICKPAKLKRLNQKRNLGNDQCIKTKRLNEPKTEVTTAMGRGESMQEEKKEGWDPAG